MEWKSECEKINKYKEKLGYMRHDIAKYISLLEFTLNENDEKIKKLDVLKGQIQQVTDVRYCKNKIIDVLIEKKLLDMQQKGIRVETDIRLMSINENHLNEVCMIIWLLIENIEGRLHRRDMMYIKINEKRMGNNEIYISYYIEANKRIVLSAIKIRKKMKLLKELINKADGSLVLLKRDGKVIETGFFAKGRIEKNDDYYNRMHDIENFIIGELKKGTTEVVNFMKKKEQYFMEQIQYINEEICSNYNNKSNKDYKEILNNLFKIQKKHADNNNIKLEIFWEEQNKCNIIILDMIRMLCNLLDNAMEAVERNEAEKRWIRLNRITEDNNTSIEIINPYDGKLKIIDDELKTIKKDEENHGMGLKIIKKIVEKYKMIMDISTDNNIFKVKIIENEKAE